MSEFIKALLFVVAAEMGDKTQLMTIAISAESHNPLFVLMGTTVGMLIADGIGILGGAWMCRHIPEKYIKWGAGIIFMIFGTITVYESVPVLSNSPIYIILYLIMLGILIYIFGIKFAYNEQSCNIALTNKEDAAEKNRDVI